MISGDGDFERLLGHIDLKITERHTFPDGWPGNIELALIDTVLSIRARYGVSADTGVRGAIKRYKAESGRSSWDDLEALANVDGATLEKTLANRQKTGGVTKAQAILAAADRLARVGVIRSVDLDRNSAEQREAYCGTRGLGPVTWAYFLMLVGHDGVKADTLVSRFVEEALGRKVNADTVGRLVTEVAKRLEMPASDLDHTIWRYMSRPRLD